MAASLLCPNRLHARSTRSSLGFTVWIAAAALWGSSGARVRTPARHPRAMSTGTEMSRSAACPEKARSAGGGSPVGLRRRAIRPPPAVRPSRARLHPFPWLDHPPRGCRVPFPEARNRGYSYPSGGRVRALQAILWSRIPPDRLQNAQNRRESGFPGSPGNVTNTQSARDPRTGGSSSPCRSRPSSRLTGPSRITATGSSAMTGAALGRGPATGLGGWSTPPPAAPAAGRKQGGQRGRGPLPASLGDARSVATGSMLASATIGVAQASAADARESHPPHRREQRPPGRRGRALRPHDRRPHGRRGTPPRALPPSAPDHAARFSPYPYPSETRDRRSWAILKPVEYPKSSASDRRPRGKAAHCRRRLTRVKGQHGHGSALACLRLAGVRLPRHARQRNPPTLPAPRAANPSVPACRSPAAAPSPRRIRSR